MQDCASSARLPGASPSIREYRARIDAGEVLFRRNCFTGSGKPLVSIVTPTLNSARTIKRTLQSVRAQSYPDIEHIIVDGQSRDETLDLVFAEKETLGVILQGRDASPADASNKGVAAASGGYISILPSDDFLEPDYVEKSIAALNDSGADFAFGDLIYVEPGRETILIPGDPQYERHIRTTMPNMSAITLMYRRECFEKIGLWDIENPYCPDYDWLLRAHLAGLRGVYTSSIRAYFSHGGVSSANYDKALAAVRDVAIFHGAHPVAAKVQYQRAVTQKRIKEILRRTLPRGMFYGLWSLVGRTKTKPLSESDSTFHSM